MIAYNILKVDMYTIILFYLNSDLVGLRDTVVLKHVMSTNGQFVSFVEITSSLST